MNYLKSICFATSLLVLFACNRTEKSQKVEHYSLETDTDSVKTITKSTEDVVAVDTIIKTELKQEVLVKKEGKHSITLQWISWDNPGTVTVIPLQNEWCSINGFQRNNGGDYLSIDGKIKRISEKELEFEGTIVTKVKSNNKGEPCVKKGKQTFYAKGNRKYFRLQNMTNCEGGMLVDYVDIYAGNSSL